MTLYLSQIRLARSPAAQGLAPLLAPSDPAARRSAQHNLLWSVFADAPTAAVISCGARSVTAAS